VVKNGRWGVTILFAPTTFTAVPISTAIRGTVGPVAWCLMRGTGHKEYYVLGGVQWSIVIIIIIIIISSSSSSSI
jgi:hypothetical protein